jgi:hypothetical protein
MQKSVLRPGGVLVRNPAHPQERPSPRRAVLSVADVRTRKIEINLQFLIQVRPVANRLNPVGLR